MSLCRQNYHADSEAGVNKQINLELHASYTYMSLAWYFHRDDVALEGHHGFFKKQSEEEREHAMILMKFQNDRGGRVKLVDIPKPEKDEWGSPMEAMQAALALEKRVNQSLLDLHALASKHNDPHMTDFIEEEFLGEQVKSIKELADMIAQLKLVGKGLGEYQFDKETLAES